MKKFGGLFLFLTLLPLAGFAAEPILPDDFFVPSIGRLQGFADIKELSGNRFEITQHFAAQTTAGQMLNFTGFCMASAIANHTGFNGFAMTMRAPEGSQVTERTLVIALMNNSGEAKGLPTDVKWTEYLPYKGFRPMCSKLVNPNYLWPAT